MANVRAKFQVYGVTQQTTSTGEVRSERVEGPIYANDPQGEGRDFWRATPSGHLEMYIDIPQTLGRFAEGAEFSIEFTPADE